MFGIAAVVLIALCAGIIAAVTSGGSNNTSTTGGGGGQPTVGLNQPVRDGKFQFVVKNVTCGQTEVGDANLGKQAQGQFCEAATTVTNIGNQAQLFDGSDQKAIGKDGATYSNDTEAELYANQNSQTFLNEINPGNTVTGTLVFDIPKTGAVKQLVLHDSPFSNGATVNVS